MATIERRGSTWRVSWRLGGRRDGARQSASFNTPKPREALTLATEAKHIIEARGHRITRAEVLKAVLGADNTVPDGMVTLDEWAKLWVEDRTPLHPDRPGHDDIQPDTIAGYAQVLRLRVLPLLGHRYLSEIDEDVVREWVKTLKATRVRCTKANPRGVPISAQTVRRAHGILHQVLGAAVPQYMPRNPAARPAGSRKNRVGLPKVTPFEGMFLAPQEVDAIWRRCDGQIRDLWFVLVRTGLRLGEALVLRVRDVTVTGGDPQIRVVRALKTGQKIGTPKSAKSRRTVSVSREVAKVLAARCGGKRPNDLLFPMPGKPRRQKEPVWRENNLRRRHWLPAVAAAMRCDVHPPAAPPRPRSGPTRKLRAEEVSTCGCPGVLRRRPRIHDARHTHVSALIKDGWTPIEIQHRVGHASFKTTMDIYGHLWQGGDARRLDSLDVRLAMVDDEDA